MDDLQARIKAQNTLKLRETQSRAADPPHSQPPPPHHLEDQDPLERASDPDVDDVDLDRHLHLESRHLPDVQPLHKPTGRGAAGSTDSRRGSRGVVDKERAAIPMMPPSPSESAASVASGSVWGGGRGRGVHYSRMMRKEECGSLVEGCLKPTGGIREEMRRAGVEPKDHQREQRAMLGQMASERTRLAQAEQLHTEQRKYKEESLRQRSVARAHQTNSTAAPSRRPRPTDAEPAAPPSSRHEPGQLPVYLQRRKAEWAAQAEAEAARAAREAECPAGLRVVGAEEKAAIMSTLEAERAKAEAALNALPFVVKTSATQRKKDGLEQRLVEIEGAMQAYSKERVLVPADA